MSEDQRFDGLFMSAIQQAQGINNFYDAMFSFMRRKTDFYSQDGSSFDTVKNNFEKHRALYQQDTKKQEAIKKKQDEEKAKQAAKQAAKKAEKEAAKAEDGATVEEIDEDEAKRIELQQIFKKQQEQKVKKEQEKKEGKKEKVPGEKDDEEENVKQKPNAGNGGETEKYVWHQTLGEVTAMIPLPAGTSAKMLDVKIGINDFKVSMKGKGGEPIVEGKWNKKIKEDESLWSIEKEDNKSILNVTIEKFEGQNWWNCLLQGDIEIDTQKVEPENSKLSDLDGETRSTVEKMMFDQAAKAQGKPTSDEREKQDKLKAFMDAHPEMDFSKAKFC